VRFRAKEQASNVAVTRVPFYPSHNRSLFGRSANYLTFAASASIMGCQPSGGAMSLYVYYPPMTAALPAAILRSPRGVSFVLHVQDMWPDSVTSSRFVPLGKSATRGSVGLGQVVQRDLSSRGHIL
jgi:colanic acid biosynthesis glycosyl transferase WcaI